MSIPFSESVAEYLLVENNSGSGRGIAARPKSGGSWRWSDNLSAKSGGSWRTIKQAYIRTSGAWETWFEMEKVFTFYLELPLNNNTRDGSGNLPANWVHGYGQNGNQNNAQHLYSFHLRDWLQSGAYVSPTLGRAYQSGDIVRGHIYINGHMESRSHTAQNGGGLNINGQYGALQIDDQCGNSTHTRIYVQLTGNGRLSGYGGNGGAVTGGGGNAGDAMFLRRQAWIQNDGKMWAGGGGGGSGSNGNCVGTYYYNYNCGKNCYRQGTGYNYNTAYGGGGGGGATAPAGSGGKNGNNSYAQNGSANSGGSGGNLSDCNANAGAKGGNPGQNGSNASYNGGQAGRYIWGNNYVKSWISTGDRRGRT
tara:strand:+ start:5480 stop:6571 length:1092 start_codon:yes stop_codon:yes gene_type:complete